MEEVLAEITRISTGKCLIQPEVAILRALSFLNTRLQIDDAFDFELILTSLLNILKINNGDISFQCALSFSFTVVDICKQIPQKVPRLYNNLIQNITPISLVLLAELTYSFGLTLINDVKQLIINYQTIPEPRYHVLYFLRRSFQGCKEQLSELAPIIFNNIKSVINYIPETYRILSLQLVRSLVKSNHTLISDSVNFFHKIICSSKPEFIKNEGLKLIGLCARLSPLKESFDILTRIIPISHEIIPIYIGKLSTKTLIKEQSNIFRYLLRTSPLDINLIIPFFTSKRKEYFFSKILSNQQTTIAQINALKELNIDEYITSNMSLMLYNNSNSEIDKEFSLRYLQSVNKEIQKILAKSILSKINTINDLNYSNYNLIKCLIDFINENEFNSNHLTKYSFDNPLYYLFNKNIEEKSIEYAIKQINSNEIFLESLITYFINPNLVIHIKQIILYVSKHFKSLKANTIFEFLKLLLKTQIETDLVINDFIHYVMSNTPNNKFYNKLINNPIITTEELLYFHNRKEIIPKNIQLTEEIILNFGYLYDKLTIKLQKSILMHLLQNLTKENICLLISIIKIPKYKSLLNVDQLIINLNGNDYLRLELISELISLNHITNFNKIFSLIQSNKSTKHIILLAAIISNIEISNKYLLLIINLLNEIIISTNTNSLPFALHSLNILLSKYCVEIITLNVGMELLTTLLILLNSNNILKPLNLYLTANVFNNILPIISYNLFDKEIHSKVLSILYIIKSIPFELSKKVYFNTLKQIIIYSPKYLNEIKFNFPKNSTINIKLSAIETLTEINKFINFDDNIHLLPKLFILLQRTNNKIILKCIKNISFSPKNNEKVLEILISILINNSLPKYINIEPLNIVKKSALSLIPLLIKDFDDEIYQKLFQCIYKSYEQFEKISFNVLTKMIKNYKKMKNKIIFDENELNQIIKFAFNINLKISSNFLIEIANENNINELINLLLNVQNKDSNFYKISIFYCKVLSKHNMKNKEITKISNLLKELIVDLMNDINKLRNFTSEFYDHIYSSFVYIESLLNEEIVPMNSLYKFLENEINNSKEIWRIRSAIFGLIEIMKYFPDKNNENDIINSLNLLIDLNNEIKITIKKQILKFCIQLTNLNLSKKVFNSLLFVCINVSFDYNLLAKIIQSLDSEFLCTVSEDLIKAIQNSEEPLKKAALFRILMEKIPKISNEISKSGNCFDVFHVCIKYGGYCDENSFVNFVNNNFELGKILIFDVFETNCKNLFHCALNIALNEFINSNMETIPLIVKGIEVIGKENFAVNLIMEKLIEKMKSGNNINEIVFVIRKLIEINQKYLNEIWNNMNEEKKKFVINCLQNNITK